MKSLVLAIPLAAQCLYIIWLTKRCPYPLRWAKRLIPFVMWCGLAIYFESLLLTMSAFVGGAILSDDLKQESGTSLP